MEFPTRPVRVVCVNAPGGGLDIIGRVIADRLTKSLAQSVIFENRAGAGGNIASEYVAGAPADGYTLLETTNNHNVNAFIYKAPVTTRAKLQRVCSPQSSVRCCIQMTEE
jgi:tripartite-type tricarboxylate transporter receptor subunit TctC